MHQLRLYLVLCLLLLHQVSVVWSGPRVRHQRSKRQLNPKEMEFNNNANLVHSARWRCNVPKPRLVYLNEATAGVPPVSPDTYLYLDATVLHRCEPAFGCCTPPLKCGASATASVTVTFKTTRMSTRVDSYHDVTFLNHTQCACRHTT